MINRLKAFMPLRKTIFGLISVRGISTMESLFNFESLLVTNPKQFVYQVELNRPKKKNSMTNQMWDEIGRCFEQLGDSDDCRVILLSGAGDCFSAGIDIQNLMDLSQELVQHEDVARRCKVLNRQIKKYQDSFSRIEQCPKPVIAAVHGACIGSSLEMICIADIRYCSMDAWFSLKEVDLGLAADVGGLQWLPKIIGSASLVRELAFTARKLSAEEALQCGLVNRIFKDKQILLAESLKIAEQISLKSPVAVQTTKKTLIYSRDHSVHEGLDFVRHQNQTMLQSEDCINAAAATSTKGELPLFSKL